METIIPSELLIHYLKLKKCPNYKIKLLLNSLLNIYTYICIIWFLIYFIVLFYHLGHHDSSFTGIRKIDVSSTTLLIEFVLFIVSGLSLIIIQFDFVEKYFEIIHQYESVLDNLNEVLKKQYPDKNYSEGYLSQYFEKHGMDGLLAWFNSGIVKELKEQVTTIEAKKDRGEYDEFQDSIKLVELITILYWIHVFLFTM